MGTIDVEECPIDVLKQVLLHMKKLEGMQTPAEREAFYAVMYGDEIGDLKILQQREDLRRTRAEADKLRADADRARAEADAQRAGL